MRYYPTEEWLSAYGRRLDESRALDAVAPGWGVNFNGDVLFVIEDLPLADTTLADLPDPVLSDIPAPVREGIADVSLAEATDYFDDTVRASLPDVAARLLTQLEENIVDDTLYAYLELERGNCTGTHVLEGPDARDPGFVISGDYQTWRQLVDGRPAVSAMLSGDLSVEGNVLRQVQYGAVLQLLGDIAAQMETVHLFEGSRPSADRALLDGAVRGPIQVQRLAQRQATWVTQTLNLF
jgi:putative sterol carrier protein